MNELLLSFRENILHFAPILFAGVIAMFVALERYTSLFLVYPLHNKAKFFEKIRDLILTDKLGEAVALCDQSGSRLIPHVLKEGLLRANQPEKMIEDGLQIAITDVQLKVHKRTAILSLIANISTLLGLLGTIVGLIHSFQAVGSASAQERSALLAAGISTAMNATMLGLMVAIPCMIAFSLFTSQSNRINSEIEQSAVKLLDFLNQRHFRLTQSSNVNHVKKDVA